MWQGFTGWHALIILVVILLLFGAPKLPALARSLGQSMKILKSEVRPEGKADGDAATTDPAAKPEEPDSSKTS
ncbi:twin-arginine translocase TatA/TatE family subunit [Agromyces humatus]|uniref:Sec-independent protein translocase protein TatA n=1 Tax=Agromyces humatus TaxID=279573 RepID=A0ABN2KHC7_9MICO|nr:twin-arginine translocase TatA/TatE family subunit [Agromyces humatus]